MTSCYKWSLLSLSVNNLEPLRLLVIINPFSGKKKSEKLYQTIARPMFEVAGAVIVQELITG